MRYSTLFTTLLAAGEGVLAAGPNRPTKGGAHAPTRVPGAYIVEFSDDHDTTDFYKSLSSVGTTRLKLDYELFKGVSIQFHDVEKAEDKALKIASETPAIKKIYPVTLYNVPKPKVVWTGKEAFPSPQAPSKRAVNYNDTDYPPHIMTQIDKLRKKGYFGKGIKIAEVDTGIDYTHPALGGCFGKGCLVSFGTDLVGDAYTGFNTPVPDDDPMDCAGHGTHVAGIIAAQPNQYGFTGAAPEVTLGAYRVLGCEGSVGNDVLIAAFNQAYEDGADIITASIGGPSGWTEDPWAVATQRIVEKGVPCTIAAGNEGAEGQLYASGAADGKKVTSIASFDNLNTPTLLNLGNFTVDSGKAEDFGWTASPYDNWDGVTLPLYAPSFDTTTTTGGCDPYPSGTPDLSKYIVLVRRGGCTFNQKAQNAVSAGAKYFLVYNNVAGTLEMALSGLTGLQAAAMVTSDQGAEWISDLKAKKTVTLKFTGSQTAQKQFINPINNVTGGALSTYTTWGATYEMDLKPQFGTPGGNILSTWPVKLGSFAVLSGTSMATPQAAGIFALLAEVKGTFDPATIQNALSASANPQVFNDGTGFYDFKAPVTQQGAGLIQAYDAAFSKTLLKPSGISFNDSDHHLDCGKFTITNKNKLPVTYHISSVNAPSFYTLGINGSIYPDPFPNEPVSDFAKVTFSKNKLFLFPYQSYTVDIRASDPTGVDKSRLPIWSGWVAINGSDGSSLSLPYQGLAGSLHGATVLGPEDAYIANSTDAATALAASTLADPVADGTSFTLPPQGTQNVTSTTVLPAVDFYMALGSSRISFFAVPAKSTKSMSTFGRYRHIGQLNGSPLTLNPRGANYVPWDGTLADGSYAAPGTYKIVVAALKIYGNPKNVKDYNIVETQSFSIKYAQN